MGRRLTVVHWGSAERSQPKYRGGMLDIDTHRHLSDISTLCLTDELRSGDILSIEHDQERLSTVVFVNRFTL